MIISSLGDRAMLMVDADPPPALPREGNGSVRLASKLT